MKQRINKTNVRKSRIYKLIQTIVTNFKSKYGSVKLLFGMEFLQKCTELMLVPTSASSFSVTRSKNVLFVDFNNNPDILCFQNKHVYLIFGSLFTKIAESSFRSQLTLLIRMGTSG